MGVNTLTERRPRSTRLSHLSARFIQTGDGWFPWFTYFQHWLYGRCSSRRTVKRAGNSPAMVIAQFACLTPGQQDCGSCCHLCLRYCRLPQHRFCFGISITTAIPHEKPSAGTSPSCLSALSLPAQMLRCTIRLDNRNPHQCTTLANHGLQRRPRVYVFEVESHPRGPAEPYRSPTRK